MAKRIITDVETGYTITEALNRDGSRKTDYQSYILGTTHSTLHVWTTPKGDVQVDYSSTLHGNPDMLDTFLEESMKTAVKLIRALRLANDPVESGLFRVVEVQIGRRRISPNGTEIVE